jgi:hypothetical protein
MVGRVPGSGFPKFFSSAMSMHHSRELCCQPRTLDEAPAGSLELDEAPAGALELDEAPAGALELDEATAAAAGCGRGCRSTSSR